MDEDNRNALGNSRRSFLKLLSLTAGAAAISPLLSSCSPTETDEYEVDIVLEQSTIHYSPETLRIPRAQP